MVAKITKKIGEWSVRETAGENAVLTQGNLEEKTEGNRGLRAEENPSLRSPRELTGEENRGLVPSGPERPELDLKERSDVDIWNAQTNGGKQRKSRSSAARRSSDESKSEQRYCQVTMSVSLERLGCVFCTSSVPAGWYLGWTASRSYITARSPLLLRPLPKFASGALQRRP